MKKILLIFLCLLVFTKVYAYENKYFSIDIDKSFKEKTIEDKKYIFSHDNEYISITINDNTNNYEVNKFTEEDINKQKEYLTQNYKDKFKKYTKKISITNIELITTETNDYLEYDVYLESKSSIGYNIYQRSRMYTSKNYVYSVLYNSDKEIKNNKYLDTFKIKDDYLRKPNILIYTILLVVMLAIILLLDYLFHKKRH